MFTDPNEFKRFHKALTEGRPHYEPWYFLLNKAEKDPLDGQGWKAPKHRLDCEGAVRALEMGHNVGIAGTDEDGLVIIDVDNVDSFKNHTFIPTLTAISSSRIGKHYFYFTEDKKAKINVALEHDGEIRAVWQYVVAPGSYAKLSDSKDDTGNTTKTATEKLNNLSDEQKPFAGMYTLKEIIPPSLITCDELPKIFTDELSKRNEIELTKNKKPIREFMPKDDYNKSALFDLDIDNVISNIPDRGRHPSLFHDSHTGKNTSISNGLLHCWRHNVSHNAISSLAVMAGLYNCVDAGMGHKNSGSGSSCIDYEDGSTLYTIWTYAKENGYIPKDDIVPSKIITWFALKNGFCTEDELVDEWKVPVDVYIKVLKVMDLYTEKEKVIETDQEKKNDDENAHRCNDCRYFRSGVRNKTEEWARCELHEEWMNPFHLTVCDDWESKVTITEDTTIIDSLRYFDDKSKFIPKILADEILHEFDIITYQDTKEIAVYVNGVYIVDGGEDLLRVTALQKLEDNFKRERLLEVIEYIRLNTLIKRADINPNPLIINLKNGMYDVLEDVLVSHDSSFKSTIQLNISYDKEAQCPAVNKYLYEVVSEDNVPVIVQYAGYCCIQDIKQQRALLLEGEMQNGKSTFIDLVCALVGQEHVSEQSLQALNSDRFARAQLNGKLINMFPDLPSQKIYDNSVFKMLTTDQWIDGEEKYLRKFRFKNTIHQIYSTNKIPDVHDPDEMSFFRRWIIVSFPNSFSGKTADKYLLDKLTTETELSGFFNIAMIGLRALLEHNEFCYIPTVKDVRKIYLKKANPIYSFLDECVVYSFDDCIKQDLYETFLEWCEQNEITTNIKNNVFGRVLKKLNYEEGRLGSGERERVWNNIGYILHKKVKTPGKPSVQVNYPVPVQKITWTSKTDDTDNDNIYNIPNVQVNEYTVTLEKKVYDDMYARTCIGELVATPNVSAWTSSSLLGKNQDEERRHTTVINSENDGQVTDSVKNKLDGIVIGVKKEGNIIQNVEDIIKEWYVNRPENPKESISYLVPEITRQLGISSELAHKNVYDVFVSYGWISSFKKDDISQRDTASMIIGAIRDMEENGMTKINDVSKHMLNNGITVERLDDTIAHMMKNGSIFEPMEGFYKCI